MIKQTLRPWITSQIVSSPGLIGPLRANRFGLDRLLGKPSELELYYQPGDPHSHLCAEWLRQNLASLTLAIKIRVVGASDPVLYPEAQMQQRFALSDAARIASAYGLRFPDNAVLPEPEAAQRAAGCLLNCNSSEAFLDVEAEISGALFGGQDVAEPSDANWQQHVQANERRRARLGHYLPAMWQLQGRWYWGLDRMAHLQSQLENLNGLKAGAQLAQLKPEQAVLPEPADTASTLDFYFSFRSPYSYLAAMKLGGLLQDRPCQLNIRPVLPMAMRGLKIPARKRFYIARDAKREADRLQIPFGRIADPLGNGALRCLTVFAMLDDTQQQLTFIQSAATGIWSQAVDVASDEGLKQVCVRAGLAWQPIKQKLTTGFDLDLAEANREALFARGLWGVPGYHIDDLVTWGQDRSWMIREYLRRKHANPARPPI